MSELPDVASLAAAPMDRILRLWEGLGYYRRARHLHEAAAHILAHHRGRFPKQFEDILALPGVGRYTAGAISSIAFDQPSPVLDGNVIRVLARFCGIAGDPRRSATNQTLWGISAALVSAAHAMGEHCGALNQSLMELGATTCTARNAACSLCPVRRACVARRENRVESLPALPKRARPTQVREVAFVLQRQGRVLMRRRPKAGINAGLWEFPTSPLPHGATATAAARAQFGAQAHITPLMVVRHSITTRRISLIGVRVEAPRGLSAAPLLRGGRWCGPEVLAALPLARAHRRLAQGLSATRS